MMQKHVLKDDQSTTERLPGTARFLAISAAYLSAAPAADSSSTRNDSRNSGVNRPAAMTERQTAGDLRSVPSSG